MNHFQVMWVYSLAIIAHVVSGQTGPTSTTVVNGTMAQLVCSNDGTPEIYIWRDVTRDLPIFTGASKSNYQRYSNFAVSDTAVTTSSTLTISDIDIEDEGQYRCTLGADDVTPDATVTVEVSSRLTLNIASPQRAGDTHTAQCDAVGGRPQETITWYINDVQQTSGVAPTNPSNTNPELFDTSSVLTFTPTTSNDGQTLSCRIIGHQLASLNQRKDTTLNVQFPPATGIMAVQIESSERILTITCFIDQSDQPNPLIHTYNITANDTIIASSSTPNTVYSPIPEFDTDFLCTASNGVGEITATATYIPESSKEKTDKSVDGVKTKNNEAFEMLPDAEGGYMALKPERKISAEIPLENISLFTRLGAISDGAFGQVWKGEIRSLSGTKQGSSAVAIRQLPGNTTDSSNILQVVTLMWKLPAHFNVVKCFGCCLDQTSILHEYISNGSLLTYLQTNGGLSHTTYANVKLMIRRIDEDKLLRFAWQIANGMDVLSSNKLIHGRLCAHNVLLTEDKQCKISDYGLSTIMPTGLANSRWMSPEAILHGAYSVQSDVWSFGIVLWEIVTLGAQPYPGMSVDVMKERVCNGYMMPRPRHCEKEIYDIMANCWQDDAMKRCQFKKLLSKLERMMERSHDYLSLSNLDEGLYAYASLS